MKIISNLKLELEYSHLTLNEEAILGDVEKIDRVYSSDETVVSTYKEYGYIWIRANSVGKAKITAYGKNAQTTVEILVYEPHIIYEKKKADGMDTLGIMILHLEETGVAQFRLRDTAGQGRYGYDYVSSDIEVSVT